MGKTNKERDTILKEITFARDLHDILLFFFLERPVLLEKYCDCVDVLLIFTNY